MPSGFLFKTDFFVVIFIIILIVFRDISAMIAQHPQHSIQSRQDIIRFKGLEINLHACQGRTSHNLLNLTA